MADRKKLLEEILGDGPPEDAVQANPFLQWINDQLAPDPDYQPQMRVNPLASNPLSVLGSIIDVPLLKEVSKSYLRENVIPQSEWDLAALFLPLPARKAFKRIRDDFWKDNVKSISKYQQVVQAANPNKMQSLGHEWSMTPNRPYRVGGKTLPVSQVLAKEIEADPDYLANLHAMLRERFPEGVVPLFRGASEETHLQDQLLRGIHKAVPPGRGYRSMSARPNVARDFADSADWVDPKPTEAQKLIHRPTGSVSVQNVPIEAIRAIIPRGTSQTAIDEAEVIVDLTAPIMNPRKNPHALPITRIRNKPNPIRRPSGIVP